MNQLLKYLLVTNVILIILGALIISFGLLDKSYKANFYTQSEIDAIHAQGNLVPLPSNGIFYYFTFGLGYLFFYGFPIFIILMSGMYQFKNFNFKGYLKSLLIPVIYILVVFIIFMIIYSLEVFGTGEDVGFLGLYIFGQLMVTFILVLVINLIIFLILRSRNST